MLIPMKRDLHGRAATVALVIAALTAALALLSFKCGNIHGRPQCGLLSNVGGLIVVAALIIESMVFSAPQSEMIVNVLIWIVAFVVAVIIASAIHLVATPGNKNKC
jgi:ABC-type Fe3+-siderophore transport system permease subunit